MVLPKKDFLQWKKDFKDKHFRTHFQKEMRDQLLNDYGVLCLSLNPYNTLMWSHYAVNHTGFCILFKPTFLEAFQHLSQSTVNYSRYLPVIDHTANTEAEITQALYKMTFYKSNKWKYEKEYRILRRPSGLVKFDIKHIDGVIAGCRAGCQLRDKIFELCQMNNIKARQAIESDKQYDIETAVMQEKTYYISSMF